MSLIDKITVTVFSGIGSIDWLCNNTDMVMSFAKSSPHRQWQMNCHFNTPA
jgi:hypothetical protein